MNDGFLKFLIFPIALLLLLSPSAAQEETPYPVLRAEDVFAEGVMVLERLPVLQANDTQRKLYYYNPALDLWQGYAYPDGLEWISIISANPYPDGTYLVSQYALLWSITDTDDVWLFDPSTGEFSHPSRSREVCGVFPVFDIMPSANDEYWVIDEAEQSLCNVLTGEQVALPQDRLWQSFYEGAYSPELTTKSNDEFVYLHGGYAYDIEAGNWHFIGEPEIDGYYTSFLLGNIILFQYEAGIYLADMQRDNSLRLLVEAGFWGHAHLLSENLLILGYVRENETVFSEYSLDTQELRDFLVLPCVEEGVVSYQCIPTDLWLNPNYPELLFYQGYLGDFHVVDMSKKEIIHTSREFLGWVNQGFITREIDYISNVTMSQNEGTWSFFHHLEWLYPRMHVYPYFVSPDSQFMIVGDSSSPSILWIVDLQRMQTLPIPMQFVLDEQLSVSLWWQSDNSLIYRVYSQSCDDDYCNTSSWRIRADAISEEQS